MHVSDGELHAFHDAQLNEYERGKIEQHLAACPACKERAAVLAEQAEQVRAHLERLSPESNEIAVPASRARARFTAYRNQKEKETMFQKLFARKYRPAWIAAAVVAILAISLAFPPVQAIANSFLGLFRVERVMVVQVNPGNLPEELGSSSQFEYLLSNDVKVEETGEPQQVASASEASDLAGIPVRLPTDVSGAQTLEVQPAVHATFDIDLAKVRALLAEIGREDIQLPDNLDGETVTLDVPHAVTAKYGDCQVDPANQGFNPDSPPQLPNCTALIQMTSPTIDAPEGLDVNKIGEAFFEVMGMTPDEAAHFVQSIDLTTTLVIPIPRYGVDYEDVTVDGVQGTFMRHSYEDQSQEFILVWLKDGVMFALTGPGGKTEALAIANSLK